MNLQNQVLEVCGDLACFTRPELKVERFSYPCPTPSSARGIFDAIFAQPTDFIWRVTRIEILERPAYIALRRNEVKEKVNLNAVLSWIAGRKDPEPIWADGDRDLLGTDEKGRTQRQTMALKSVRYRLHAWIHPWPGKEDKLTSLEAQFRRRASHGKCFYQPYLGCREFPGYFRFLDGADSWLEPKPHAFDLDVGFMLYDVFDLSRPGSNGDTPAISLFEAKIKSGVLEVPPYGSSDVLKVQGVI